MSRTGWFVLLATILAIPCWWISDWYQAHVLARLVVAVAAMLGRPLFIRDLEVYAPVEVAVFLALSLADRRGGWKGFLRTILLGIPLMIGLEVGILCVASGPELLGIRGQLRTVWHEMSYYIVKSILWVDPLVAWLLVGGGWGVLAGRERSRADGKAQGSSPQKRRDRMRAIGPIPSTGRRST